MCKKYGGGRGKAAPRVMPLGQPAKSELLPLLWLPTLLLLGQTLRLLGQTLRLPGQTLRLPGLGLGLPGYVAATQSWVCGPAPS